MPIHKALRYLQITFSATCGILCLVVIMFWVRSSYYLDVVDWRMFRGWAWQTVSNRGQIVLSSLRPVGIPRSLLGARTFSKYPPEVTTFGFISDRYGQFTIWVPHWFMMVLTMAVAIAPWMKRTWRFSLRTLLIATTFVAIVLGAIMFSIQ